MREGPLIRVMISRKNIREDLLEVFTEAAYFYDVPLDQLIDEAEGKEEQALRFPDDKNIVFYWQGLPIIYYHMYGNNGYDIKLTGVKIS